MRRALEPGMHALCLQECCDTCAQSDTKTQKTQQCGARVTNTLCCAHSLPPRPTEVAPSLRPRTARPHRGANKSDGRSQRHVTTLRRTTQRAANARIRRIGALLRKKRETRKGWRTVCPPPPNHREKTGNASAWCTEAPCARGEDQASCVPSRAGRASGNQPCEE